MNAMVYAGKTKYDIYVTSSEDGESKTELFVAAVDEFSVEVGTHEFALVWEKYGERSERYFSNRTSVSVMQSASKLERVDLTGFKEIKIDKSDTDSDIDDDIDDEETVPEICKTCLDKHVRRIVHEELANHLGAFALDMFNVVHNDRENEED